MFTIEQIRSWTPRELEQRVFALDPDAGEFSVPVVQAIVKKLYGQSERARDPLYGQK